ncbi:MAG: ZIP family metal transporter [Pseudomonadota bacterium]
MLFTLLIATATGLCTGLGVVPFLFRRTIPRWSYDMILGLGAGLMIAAATLGLLSTALEYVRPEGAPLQPGALAQVLTGFALGVAAMTLMDWLIPHHHAGGHHEHIGHAHAGHGADASHPHEHEHGEEVHKGLLITGAMTIHRFPEGFAIGIAFASGHSHSLGWLLAVTIAFQNICEGAVMGAPLRYGGWSRLKSLLAVSATGMAMPVAALVGYAAGSLLSGALPFSLSVAAGALVYLISNEIIPETHSHGHEKVATLGLLAGFLVVIVVRSLEH